MINQLLEVHNKIYQHLLKQGEPAVEEGRCKYRTSTGLMCAAGCLIDDRYYNQFLENQTIVNAEVQFVLKMSGYDVMDCGDGGKYKLYRLIRAWQSKHDVYYLDRLNDWAEYIHSVAEEIEANYINI